MRPLRLAMVGGGPGAFIGPVHRMGALLDGRLRLVAGAFSRDGTQSAATGGALGVRAYGDYETMIAAEARLEDGAEAVAIVTPNHTHLAIAKAALGAGLHVMSDKPATATLEEAHELALAVRGAARIYAVAYAYTGYPMVREAREIVQRGELGAVRKVVVDYAQGWLSEALEADGARKGAWRTDPAQAGMGGAIGDIGVHAFNLAEFVTGLRVTRLSADLGVVVPNRRLDDDCAVLLRFDGGARGVLTASQISAGGRNGLRISVFGERGGVSWSHERHDELAVDWLDRPSQVLHAGAPYLSVSAKAATRLPSGHPEGFIEAFATLYREFADAVAGRPTGLLPGIDEGVRGLTFVDCAVRSNGRGWVELGAAQ